MKIQEFRDLLKGADRERLEKAFSECYKQLSKAKKEEIDDLVRDILSGGEENSRKKIQRRILLLWRERSLFLWKTLMHRIIWFPIVQCRKASGLNGVFW